MVTGLFDSSIWEMGSAGYIWTYRCMQRQRRHRNRRMDGRTEQRGLEARGAAERENLIREEVQGSVGKGKIKDD